MKPKPLNLVAALGALAIVVAAPTSRAASGTPITSCAQTVTTNAVLTQDLNCTGAGVVVGAPGITIDLKGFTLRGDRDPGDYGIDDSAGYDNVSVKNGVLRNFGVGVLGNSSANNLKATSVIASGNAIGGIAVVGSSASIKSTTTAGNGSYGIATFGTSTSVASSIVAGNAADGISVGGDQARITSVTVAGNGDRGIVVGGDFASIRSSTVTGNGTVGIVVGGNAASITGNRTDGNGFVGGTSDSAGLGVYVLNFTVSPTGTNLARGNDDPAECNPGQLC